MAVAFLNWNRLRPSGCLMPAKLNGAMPLAECDRFTRAGRLDAVLEENARIVLMGHMGLSRLNAACCAISGRRCVTAAWRAAGVVGSHFAAAATP